VPKADNKCVMHIIGVTSSGSVCGSGNGFYTPVVNYIDWIESIVWPPEKA
jgi:secreted trypsin-like serine protease